MIQPSSFFVISEKGKDELPTKSALDKFIEKEFVPLLYLDANMCLDIVHYFNGNLKDPSRVNNIQTLVAYAQANKIGVFQNLGVLELCLDKINLQFDFDKFKEFVNKIIYVFDTPIEFHSNSLKDVAYNYQADIENVSYQELGKLLNISIVSYLALLKIYTLAKKNNPSQATYLFNLESFLKWSDEVLDTSMALEINLACEIFAGNSKLGRMIELYKKSSIEEIISKILSTSWDFIHIRQFQKAIDRKWKLFFISRDNDIQLLFKKFSLHSAIRLENGLLITALTNISSNPFKSLDLRDKAIILMNNFQKKRESKLHLIEKQTSLKPLIPLVEELLLEIQNSA